MTGHPFDSFVAISAVRHEVSSETTEQNTTEVLLTFV